MPADYQEEVIADSEEEDIYAPLDTTHETIDHYESTRVTRPSSVDTYGIPTIEPSNISNFTDLPSTLFARSDISSVANSSTVGDLATTTGSTSRPKPRPIKRKNDLDISNSASSSSALPLVVDDGIKKKDRPRPRPIKRKQSTVDSDPHLEAGGIDGAIVQQTKDDSGPYGMDIAERAKVRRRTTKEKALSVPKPSLAIVSPPQKHKKGNTHPEPLEVIELSSEDELSMAAPARPKKGPKAKGTPRGRVISNTAIIANHTAPAPSSQPTIPVPSSSLSGYNHAPLHLPPSDIPESPLTEPEHPPIAALSEPDSLDIGPQLDQGHEPSLFTPEPAARKRKRGVIYDDDEEDELATIKPPIPTFFASSSPPPLNPAKQSKTPSKKQKSCIPLKPLPAATKKKPKPRSKKEESTAVSATGDGGSTAPKRKGKGKKKSDEVANVPHEEVEGSYPNMASPSRSTATPNLDDDSTRRAREEAALNDPPHSESKRKGNRSRKPQTIAPEMALPRAEPFEENPPAKENHPPVTPAKPPGNASSSASKLSGSSLTSRYSIAPRTKSTPMSELIRRVNSMPGSPFATSPAARTGSTYSPYLKTSKSTLSRIAPLHPNRRAPPPPPPPPPPKKKTKKEIEREEKWEEELIESLGGLDAWVALSDADRKDLRRGKFEMEMNGWD